MASWMKAFSRSNVTVDVVRVPTPVFPGGALALTWKYIVAKF